MQHMAGHCRSCRTSLGSVTVTVTPHAGTLAARGNAIDCCEGLGVAAAAGVAVGRRWLAAVGSGGGRSALVGAGHSAPLWLPWALLAGPAALATAGNGRTVPTTEASPFHPTAMASLQKIRQPGR